MGERIAALSSLSLCVRSLLAMLIPRPSVHCLLPCPCAFSSWSVRWLLYISPSSSVSRIQPCAVHATQFTTGRGMLSMCGCADEARPLSITHRSVRCCAARDRSNRGDLVDVVVVVVVVVGGGGGTASSFLSNHHRLLPPQILDSICHSATSPTAFAQLHCSDAYCMYAVLLC